MFSESTDQMLSWTPYFSVLDSTFFVLDSTFWLESTLKIDPGCISGLAHLGSAERHDMLVPSTRTQLGRRSFHVATPAVWNALPSHLLSPSINRRQFRAGLKKTSLHTGLRIPLRILLKSVFFYICICIYIYMEVIN